MEDEDEITVNNIIKNYRKEEMAKIIILLTDIIEDIEDLSNKGFKQLGDLMESFKERRRKK